MIYDFLDRMKLLVLGLLLTCVRADDSVELDSDEVIQVVPSVPMTYSQAIVTPLTYTAFYPVPPTPEFEFPVEDPSLDIDVVITPYSVNSARNYGYVFRYIHLSKPYLFFYLYTYLPSYCS